MSGVKKTIALDCVILRPRGSLEDDKLRLVFFFLKKLARPLVSYTVTPPDILYCISY
jgi:hypothetical protein